jgi:hypothetical protein
MVGFGGFSWVIMVMGFIDIPSLSVNVIEENPLIVQDDDESVESELKKKVGVFSKYESEQVRNKLGIPEFNDPNTEMSIVRSSFQS